MSPLADLSYRAYDGPLASPKYRWWVIARQTMQMGFRRKGLWLLMAASAWYYIVMLVILFFVQKITGATPQGEAQMRSFLGRLVWKDQLLHGFSFAQMPLLLVALILGAGAIANDNRANALLVYLSKPCTKLDYMIGKFVGVFLPILGVVTIPTVIFYLYGAMTFRAEGFIADDPWLLPKMLLILPISSALHAALILAISSLFNQGRVAGATYAGLYFLGNFFTLFMKVAWFSTKGEAPLVDKLFYFSVDGLQIGLAKAVLGTNGSAPFGLPQRGTALPIPAPSAFAIIGVILLITIIALGVAWRRIRAVEVVGG
ncbi:hypothetical protein EON79_07835 [bacterium]|nr:MAG: hypothetical protein EON79_07835 [bacterium]